MELISELAEKEVGVKQVTPTYGFNGSEDATILGRRVQQHGGKAIYFIVGADRTAGHHQAEFDFDEKQLLTAVNLYTALLQRLNG